MVIKPFGSKKLLRKLAKSDGRDREKPAFLGERERID